MRGRMEARIRAICADVGLELRRWMRPVKTVARRRAVVQGGRLVFSRITETNEQHDSRAHGAQFTNAHMRGVRGCGDQVGVAAARWETLTKIFSQISPKRSPGTTQGPDPLSGSGP